MTEIDCIRAARAQALEDAAVLLETRAAALMVHKNATTLYGAWVLQYAVESIRKLKEQS